MFIGVPLTIDTSVLFSFGSQYLRPPRRYHNGFLRGRNVPQKLPAHEKSSMQELPLTHGEGEACRRRSARRAHSAATAIIDGFPIQRTTVDFRTCNISHGCGVVASLWQQHCGCGTWRSDERPSFRSHEARHSRIASRRGICAR